MKKILTFAAIVAAVAVQAASVDWKADKQTALKNYNYAIVDPATVTALLTGGSSPYADTTTLAADVAAGKAFDADALADLANRLSAGTLNGKGTASGTVEDVGASFTMIFWTGTPAEGGSFLYKSYSTSGYTYELPATPDSTLAITAADLTSGTFKEAYAVPEPTTVALLALGLAAVGLKRKVA